jgi:hypothetical protein
VAAAVPTRVTLAIAAIAAILIAFVIVLDMAGSFLRATSQARHLGEGDLPVTRSE